jgi:hypothetical protein
MAGVMKRLAVLVCALLLVVPPAFGQAPAAAPKAADASAPAAEAAGVEELAKILGEKGLLSKEEVAAVVQKKGEAGASALAALAELLKAKGVLTPDEAGKVVAASHAPAPPVVLYYAKDEKDMERITADITNQIKQDVQQSVKNEIKDEIMQETNKAVQAAAAPEWTQRIRFGGDVRLRYEGDFFDKNNATLVQPSNPTQLMNTTDNQQSYKVRARLGVTVDVNDSTEAGVRLLTGSTTNPVSTNQTLGNYENKYGAAIDLAYIKEKIGSDLTLIGGRMPNPWFFSELIWYRDLTFDGFAATYRHPLSSMFEGFATAAVSPLQTFTLSGEHDKWLYAGQVGLDVKPRKDLFAKFGVAYYDYQNIRGIPNNPLYPGGTDWTAPAFQQKGNTLFVVDPSSELLGLAANYREVDTLATLDIGFWNPIHVVLLGDYVKNVGFDRKSVIALTQNPAVTAETHGYQLGLSVGYRDIDHFGQWRTFAYYRYLQADAVLDAFTDPDFHLGGTNAKGWIMGGDFGLRKNLWLSAKWTTANEISGPPLSIDSLFIDMNVRF